MNVSVALKLTLARFINSSAVLIIVNWAAEKWFDGGNLVYDATILIGILAFQAPFMELLYIPGLIKWFKKKKEIAKGPDCRLTQREANMLCEGGSIDAANTISNFMNMVMTCAFYAPLIPHAIPLSMISTFLGYWTLKYSLLRRYKMPEMFSELMATFFSNFLPWLVLCEAGAATLYYWKQQEAFNEYVISDKIRTNALIGLILCVVCIILPFRQCLKKLVNNSSVNVDDEKKYEDLCNNFSSDYDRENPLTSKKGKLRQINI